MMNFLEKLEKNKQDYLKKVVARLVFQRYWVIILEMD